MQTSPLTSAHNPRVKSVVKLHQAKYRQALGLILIEGSHPIEEALQAGIQIEELYYLAGSPLPVAYTGQPVEVSEAVMGKLSTTDTPTHLVAVARRPQFEKTDPFKTQNTLLLGCCGIQDPGNLGTLIRTACAFGVNYLIYIGANVDPFHPKVIRSSAGLVFSLPVIQLDAWSDFQQAVQGQEDLVVLGTDAHKGQSYKDADYRGHRVILLGGEGQGLPPEVWEQAMPLHIPMEAKAESLNVAIAGAIILSQAYQQRR